MADTDYVTLSSDTDSDDELIEPRRRRIQDPRNRRINIGDVPAAVQAAPRDAEIPNQQNPEPQSSLAPGDQASNSNPVKVPSTSLLNPKSTSSEQNPERDVPSTSGPNASSTPKPGSSKPEDFRFSADQPSTSSASAQHPGPKDLLETFDSIKIGAPKDPSRDSGISTSSSSSNLSPPPPDSFKHLEDPKNPTGSAEGNEIDSKEHAAPKVAKRSSKRRRIEEEDREEEPIVMGERRPIIGDLLGTIPPVGLTRQRFVKMEEQRKSKEQRKRKSKKQRKRKSKKKLPKFTGPKDSGNSEKDLEPREGAEYQVSEEELKWKNKDPVNDADRDSPIFIPFEMLDRETLADFEETPRMDPDLFYPAVLSTYWNAIWRQWRGQITFEAALLHLMRCEYQIPAALDTIDEVLVEMAHEMKPICVAQEAALRNNFEELRKSFETSSKKPTKEMPLRQLQSEVMRNYHLGEIQNYEWNFVRFQFSGAALGNPCNCNSVLCSSWDCEPRVSCTNCNRHYRKPRDAQEEKRCFICDTYSTITGGSKRPAEAVLFNDRELRFIEDWNRREEEQKRGLTREEVEAQVAEENTARWKRLELTEEEMDMVEKREVKQIKNGKKVKKGKNRENGEKLGKRIAAQLQPVVLPLFRRCECWRNRAPSNNEQNNAE